MADRLGQGGRLVDRRLAQVLGEPAWLRIPAGA
jgi:hypothetical protein